MHHDTIDRIVTAFESLQPDTVQALQSLYADGARFTDPFNEVQGWPAIAAIFHDMFEQMQAPRFVVTQRIADEAQCVLMWELHFRFRRFHPAQAQCIRGVSYLVFDDEGRIHTHCDYWDAAHQLYARLPIIGGVMRWLRRRAQAA